MSVLNSLQSRVIQAYECRPARTRRLAHLCQQQEGVVRAQVLGEEVHAVSLQGRHRVLFRGVQGGHHGFRTDVRFIRVEKP